MVLLQRPCPFCWPQVDSAFTQGAFFSAFLEPLLLAHGVQLATGGHVHNYVRGGSVFVGFEGCQCVVAIQPVTYRAMTRSVPVR